MRMLCDCRAFGGAICLVVCTDVVSTGDFTLALECLHFDSSLAVQKDLQFLGWDGSVVR